MQKAGTWTWDTFVDLCKKLTRDINNDGIIDVYALANAVDDRGFVMFPKGPHAKDTSTIGVRGRLLHGLLTARRKCAK
jgi:hypothetical protein